MAKRKLIKVRFAEVKNGQRFKSKGGFWYVKGCYMGGWNAKDGRAGCLLCFRPKEEVFI